MPGPGARRACVADPGRGARAAHAALLALGALAVLTACERSGAPEPETGGTAHRLVTIAMAPHPAHGIVAMTVTDGAGGAAVTARDYLFRAPAGAEVRQLATSADGRRLVYALVPPPDEDVALLDRSALYLAEPTGGDWSARRLVGGDAADAFHLEPALSPDGRHCYFVHVTSTDDYLSGYTAVTLRRLDLATGAQKDIIANGIWPAVAPDGDRIAFVGVQPQSQQRGLFVADADGNNLSMLVPVGRFFDIDAPVFSPDGEWIWFAVAEQDTRERRAGTWQRLLPAAHAHNDHDVPSHWWRVRVDGDDLQQVSRREAIMTYGGFTPAGDAFVFATTEGLYRLPADGAGEAQALGVDGSWMSIGWLAASGQP